MTPRELGGNGAPGSNPEQLFAAGYPACFLGALGFVAGRDKVKLPSDASVEGAVGIGPIPTGFGIEVELKSPFPAWIGRWRKTSSKRRMWSVLTLCAIRMTASPMLWPKPRCWRPPPVWT